jgi:hypothetical protein
VNVCLSVQYVVERFGVGCGYGIGALGRVLAVQGPLPSLPHGARPRPQRKVSNSRLIPLTDL